MKKYEKPELTKIPDGLTILTVDGIIRTGKRVASWDLSDEKIRETSVG